MGAFWGCRSQEVLPGESGWLCSSASTEWQAVSAVAYRIRAPAAVGRRVHQGNIAPAGRFRDVGHVWVLQCGGEPARVRRDRRRRARNSARFRRHHHHRRRRRRRASPRRRRRRCRRLLRAPSAGHTPSPGRRPPTWRPRRAPESSAGGLGSRSARGSTARQTGLTIASSSLAMGCLATLSLCRLANNLTQRLAEWDIGCAMGFWTIPT